MNYNRRILAHLALVSFALLSAARDVEAKLLFQDQRVDPMFLTWFGCLVTFVAFFLLSCVRVRGLYLFSDVIAASRNCQRDLMLSNVFTLVAFLTTFLAIDTLDAYINAIIDYGASPVVTAAFAVLFASERISSRAVIGMVISVVGIALLTPALIADSKSQTPQFVGLIYAAVSCFSFAFNQIINKRLVNAGIIRERLIINRLWLIVSVLGVWLVFRRPDITVALWKLIVWSILGIAIPLYLLVYAFEWLKVKSISYSLFLIPVFALAGTLLFTPPDGQHLWLYVASAIVVVIGVLISENAPDSATSAKSEE